MAETEEVAAAPESVAASVEKTFALIKPDAVKNGYADEITNLAELFGFKIVAKKKFMARPPSAFPAAAFPHVPACSCKPFCHRTHQSC